MSRFQTLKGTRDYYPEEMRIRRWIEEKWRKTALRFGFDEYDAPVLEPLELYTQKSGEEIVGQLYAFEDKGGRQVALRPEMTPSLARMIAMRGSSLPRPLKWFSIPRLFRYEKPQRGRFREFWQLNLDIVGVEGVEADAEIMAAGIEVLRACGLGEYDFVLRYSDRRLLEAVLNHFDIPMERHPAVFSALDRLLRGGSDAAKAALVKAGLQPEKSERLVTTLLDSQSSDLLPSKLGWANALSQSPELERLQRLEEYLEAYGLRTMCKFDPAIVRGLAYYTGIVFEMYDRQAELRAICGGGRYDRLILGEGGKELPAVGFGLGEAVLIELLRDRNLLPLQDFSSNLLVIPLSAADHTYSIQVATELRASDFAVDLWLTEQTFQRALKRAEQARVRYAILISSVERMNGQVYVHDLVNKKKKERIERTRLIEWLTNQKIS